MCQEFGLLSAPLGSFLGPAGLVPFDTYSLAFKFEWIVNESETNFELYIKLVLLWKEAVDICYHSKVFPCIQTATDGKDRTVLRDKRMKEEFSYEEQ